MTWSCRTRVVGQDERRDPICPFVDARILRGGALNGVGFIAWVAGARDIGVALGGLQPHGPEVLPPGVAVLSSPGVATISVWAGIGARLSRRGDPQDRDPGSGGSARIDQDGAPELKGAGPEWGRSGESL